MISKIRKLLGRQFETARHRHIIGIFQLRFLFLQLMELCLHFRNLCFGLFNFLFQFFNFRIQFITSNLLRQTPKCIKMLLPVACIDVGIRDRVSAVDHHSISYIDPYMACAAGIVGPLEEDQVARFCICA